MIPGGHYRCSSCGLASFTAARNALGLCRECIEWRRLIEVMTTQPHNG